MLFAFLITVLVAGLAIALVLHAHLYLTQYSDNVLSDIAFDDDQSRSVIVPPFIAGLIAIPFAFFAVLVARAGGTVIRPDLVVVGFILGSILINGTVAWVHTRRPFLSLYVTTMGSLYGLIVALGVLCVPVASWYIQSI